MLTDELNELLMDNGATLTGFCDLYGIAPDDMPYGVSVAVKIPASVVRSISNGPTRAYFDAYHALNRKLDDLVLKTEAFLKSRGFHAQAQTLKSLEEFGVYRTRLPHKTIATRSGLGWIGKSALFVNSTYGPAIRLSSLITDAPLDCAVPITKSKCGACTACVESCPGKAISGILWGEGLDRDDFFDVLACRKKARELAAACFGEEITLCGKCIEVCPYTKRYIGHDMDDAF